MAHQGRASGEKAAPPQEQSFFDFDFLGCLCSPKMDVEAVAGKDANRGILGNPPPLPLSISRTAAGTDTASPKTRGGIAAPKRGIAVASFSGSFGPGSIEAPKDDSVGGVLRRSEGEKLAQEYRQAILKNERQALALAQSLKEKEAKLYQLSSWYVEKVKVRGHADFPGTAATQTSLAPEMQERYMADLKTLKTDIAEMRDLIRKRESDAEAAKMAMRSGTTAIFRSSQKNLRETPELVKSASLRARHASPLAGDGRRARLPAPESAGRRARLPLREVSASGNGERGSLSASPTRVSRREGMANMGGSSRNLLSQASMSKMDESSRNLLSQASMSKMGGSSRNLLSQTSMSKMGGSLRNLFASPAEPSRDGPSGGEDSSPAFGGSPLRGWSRKGSMIMGGI